MKKINVLFGTVSLVCGCLMTSADVFAAQQERQKNNLDMWGVLAYWKTCGLFNVGTDHPCIGDSANSCSSKSWNSNKWPDDEWGVTLMVAVETTEGGAKFCPTTIIAANTDGYCAWTEYYMKESGCVWLCRPGRTGESCEQQYTNVTSCDNALLLKSDYDSITGMDASTNANIEDTIPNFGANRYSACGYGASFDNNYGKKTKGQEHDVIMAISDWLPSGHGAWVRPDIARAQRAGWKPMKSWINIYPAASNQDGTGESSSVLACKNGYMPNASMDDCVSIKPELCGESVDDAANGVAAAPATEIPFCGGVWTKANYEANKDNLILHTCTSCATAPEPCYWFTCKGIDMAYTNESRMGLECSECMVGPQVGIYAGNGVCYRCPNGKFFDEKAGAGKGFCVDGKGYGKDILRYGPGKNAQTNIEEQCWTMGAVEDYKDCVTGKTAQGSSGRTPPKKGRK